MRSKVEDQSRMGQRDKYLNRHLQLLLELVVIGIKIKLCMIVDYITVISLSLLSPLQFFHLLFFLTILLLFYTKLTFKLANSHYMAHETFAPVLLDTGQLLCMFSLPPLLLFIRFQCGETFRSQFNSYWRTQI